MCLCESSLVTFNYTSMEKRLNEEYQIKIKKHLATLISIQGLST